jgi:Delta7-sterol 5-desaturase
MLETSAEWVTSFLPAFLTQAVGYFAFVGLAFVVTRRLAARWLEGRRIHVRGPRVDRRQIEHEVKHSLGVLALGTAQSLVVQALLPRGVDTDGEHVGWTVGAFAAVIVFNDLWFYGVHRLLHTRWLFAHVHGVHHRSLDVNPFSSYSFHWIESLLVTGWLVPMLLWTPIPLPALVAAQIVGLLNNVGSHLGYELLPRWWLRAPFLRWTNTATFHALHHERFTGNFGLFSRVWDRLFGTEIADYERAFDDAHRVGPSKPPQ